MGLILRLVLLLAIVALTVPTVLHAEHGASWSNALGATMVDFQVIPACPDKAGDAWRFLDRGELALSVDQAKEAYCVKGAYAGYPDEGIATVFSTATPATRPGSTVTVVPTATHPATGTPLQTAAPVTPVPTSSIPEARLQIWREYMLQLINKDRQANGVGPVTLGDNPAPQLHAEDLFANKFLSHWGQNGLKPYMRYTLAGGTGYAAENVSGEPCPRDPMANYRKTPTFDELQNDEMGFMNSPGHRANILNPWHQEVSLGLVCDDVGCAVVQFFEADYVAWDTVPTLDQGILRMSGTLTDGFSPVSVQVWYDEPPHDLTFGQLGRTYSYGVGQKPAVFLREPPSRGFFYTEDSSEYSWSHGVDPYTVDPDVPRPQRVQQGGVLACTEWPRQDIKERAIVPWVTASTWKTGSSGAFTVQADISKVLADLGPGAYTVVVWGAKNGQNVALTNYTLFVQ